MALSDAVSRDAVAVELAANDKQGIIEEMIGLLDAAYRFADPGQVRKAVLAREELMSTGIGQGVALPHAKVASVDRMMVGVGLKPGGVDFQSADGRPAQIFFMIISPAAGVEQHLRIMATISRMLKDDGFRGNLLACPDQDAVLRLISTDEARYG
jgi:fructose-specific phosphotransferase system IIA component